MKKLLLDVETRSRCDLTKAGARRYAVDPSTQITTACWKWAGERVVHSACNIPGLAHLGNSTVANFTAAIAEADRIVAHNIAFDASVIFSTIGPCGLDLNKLDDTMARAQRAALPGGLDALCEALGVQGKSMDGHRLVMATCKPRKDGTFNEDGALFKALLGYNVQDVHCLESVDRMLPPLSPDELEIWRRTWTKNARGLPLDIELCERIAAKRAEIELEIANDLRGFTGGAVTAITQRARIQEWCKSKGVPIPNLQRATVESWLDMEAMPFDVYQVLTILFDSGGSAPTKAQALLDRHVAGTFQDATRYYGARSGRGTSEGCFGADTLVLTQTGWKRIVEMSLDDLTWDGESWNAHNGLLLQGVRATTQMCGLIVTEDHMVSCGSRWNYVKELNRVPWLRFRALATGLGTLLSLVLSSGFGMLAQSSGATAGRPSGLSDQLILKSTEAARVCNARTKSTLRIFLKNMAMKTSAKEKLRAACCGLYQVSTTGVPIQMIKIGLTMEAEAFVLPPNGLSGWCAERNRLAKSLTRLGGVLFWSTSSRLKTTARRVFNLIGLTTIEVTNRVIFALSVAKKMRTIGAQCRLLKKTECFSEVYDLLDCGPRNRYMILSSGGPLLVHNCNMFNIARPSGKYDTGEVIKRLAAEPDGEFTNTELSDVLRGTIKAPDGFRVIDSDLSNIELRKSLWLAGDHQKLELLRSGNDLYAATAAAALGIPTLSKKSHPKERQAYKKVVLSGGYGVGIDKLFISFKSDKDLPYEYRRDLTYPQVAAIHAGYRDANAPLQMTWKGLGEAMRAALAYRGAVVPACGGKVSFFWRKDEDVLDIILPSGRKILHYKPRINEEGEITFWRAWRGKMLEQRTWGGGILELICQASARDILTAAECAIEAELPDVHLILDIYDSVVALAPENVAHERMGQIVEIMRRVPDWAPGLPLDAEATVTERMEK